MNPHIKKIEAPSELYQHSQKRDCFDKVCSFIDDKRCLNGKILALYGLRRTGKSFLLSQIKSKYGSIVEHLEFPLVVENGKPVKFEMNDVYAAVDECIKNGKTVVLLDEITNVEDFTYDSEILADHYGKKGITIIIAGTDSLGLKLAGNKPLLGRKPDIPMTYISFAEHCRIFGVNDIDDYIKYGGLMHEGLSAEDDMIRDIISQRRYLNDAVSGNITRSLKKFADYNSESTEYDEIRKYTEDDIKQIINKLVEDYSGSFNETKINNKQLYNIIDYPLKRFRKTFGDSGNLQITNNRKKISDAYAEQINIRCDLTKPATGKLMRELENCLMVLDVVSGINVCRFGKINGRWDNGEDRVEYHIVQPAIKYYQLEEAVKMYMNTADLSELSRSDREFLATKLQEKVFGDMTEHIVQFDTMQALDNNNFYVCKPEFSVDGESFGEYDLLIFDKRQKAYYGFEVKHSMETHPDQYKTLENQEIAEVLNYQYGKRENVAVLYRGPSGLTEDNRVYLNITDFLKSLGETLDIAKTMKKLLAALPHIDYITDTGLSGL